MKKKIIVLAVLISFGSSSLFAEDFWGFDMGKTGSYIMDVACIVVGGGLAAVPFFVSDMNQVPYNITLWVTGGSIALIGFIGLIYDLVTPDSDYYAMEKNPILEHVALNIAPKRVFVGGIWRW
jgi:hypothetical protein